MKFPFTVPRGRRFDVLGFGTNAVDFLITVPKFPEFGSKIDLREYVQAAGGEAASTMAGLRRLGLKTAYAGSFGDDDAGDFGTRSLLIEGVDLSLSRRVPGAKTQIAFIVIDETSGERTIIWQRDPTLAWSAADAPADAAAQCNIVHMTPHDTDACVELARAAKASGTLVSLDIDSEFEGVDELLQLTDILICSREFPAKFTGLADPREALAELNSRFGSSLVGMTLGKEGSVFLCSDSYVETKGFAVPGGCKDTTGAGDAFRTGLLYSIIKGESVENAARAANAVAVLKCRDVGARTALPTRNELERFLKNS